MFNHNGFCFTHSFPTILLLTVCYFLELSKNLTNVRRIKSIFCVPTLVFEHFLQAVRHALGQLAAMVGIDVSFTQTSLIADQNPSRLVGCFSKTLFLMRLHKFLIGFRLTLFPGHSNGWILFCSEKFFHPLLRWCAAPSCIKIWQL